MIAVPAGVKVPGGHQADRFNKAGRRARGAAPKINSARLAPIADPGLKALPFIVENYEVPIKQQMESHHYKQKRDGRSIKQRVDHCLPV
jgi:hypothetical protein